MEARGYWACGARDALDVKGLVDAAAVAGLRKDRIDPTRLAGTPGSYPAPERSLVALNAVGR